MPQSKKRHHSHHPQHHDTHVNKPAISKTSRMMKAGIIFFAVLGLLVSYFIAGTDTIWLIAGTAIGAVAGYLFSKQMNKTFSK